MDGSDEKLLLDLLADDRLGDDERAAFADMRRKRQRLSGRQRAWAQGVARRLDITPPAENLFSNLSLAEQAEHRRRASGVEQPWLAHRPLKPPGRR